MKIVQKLKTWRDVAECFRVSIWILPPKQIPLQMLRTHLKHIQFTTMNRFTVKTTNSSDWVIRVLATRQSEREMSKWDKVPRWDSIMKNAPLTCRCIQSLTTRRGSFARKTWKGETPSSCFPKSSNSSWLIHRKTSHNLAINLTRWYPKSISCRYCYHHKAKFQ